MSTFTVNSTTGQTNQVLTTGGSGNILSVLSGISLTQFWVQLNSGQYLRFNGSGFTYNPLNLAAGPNTGNWTSTDITDAGGNVLATLNNFGTLSGSSINSVLTGAFFTGADSLTGNIGNDLLIGSDGNDTITGGGGADTLLGGNDNDVFVITGNAPASGIISLSIEGGSGTDQLRFAANSDLYISSGSPTFTVLSIEELYLAGTSNVTISSSDISVAGISESVKLISDGAGANILTIAPDATFSAEAFTFLNWDANDYVFINGDLGAYSSGTLTGTTGRDRIRGWTSADTLIGGDGNDTLEGQAGADSLVGGNNDDSLVGGAGADTLVGGFGDDIFAYTANTDIAGDSIDGGPGMSATGNSLSVQFSGTADFTTATIASLGPSITTLALSGGGGHNVIFNASQFNSTGVWTNLSIQGDAGADTVTINGVSGTFSAAGFTFGAWNAAIDRVVINGTEAIADNITGTSQADSILGGDPTPFINFNDTINGGDGDDTISGGYGFDSLDGGNGFDTNDLSFYNGDTQFNMATGVTTFLPFAGTETAINFERAVMGNGNDSITGTTGANEIVAGGGNDTLDGGAGNDTLIGGTGNDVYVVDSYNDVITEAAGDAADEVRTTLISFTLGTHAGSANVENLTFTGPGSFEGVGNGLANSITGGAGNDTLYGLDGADILVGGAGSDNFIYSAATETTGDVIDGGTDAGGTFDRLIVNFAGADFSTATFLSAGTTSIEALQLLNGAGASAAFNAAQFGANGISTAFRIDALGGNADIVTINNVNGTFSAAAFTFLTWNAVNDRIVINGGGSADSITGTSQADNIFGNGNDDTIEGGLGDDTLDGGAGTGDIISFASYNPGVGTTGIVVNLELQGTVQNTNAGTDTFIGFEGVTGSAFADSIYGGNGNDTLRGGAGADFMTGNGGNDQVFGEAGNDQLYVNHFFANGVGEIYDGGADFDTFSIGGNNTTTFDLRDDSIVNFEALRFAADFGGGATVQFNASQFTQFTTLSADAHVGQTIRIELSMDTLTTLNLSALNVSTLNQPNDRIVVTGDGDAESITGTANADSLVGNGGADTLDGGAGADTLTGGTGNDVYVVDSYNDAITEAAGDAADEVRTTLTSFTLGTDAGSANVENLTFTGIGVFFGVGSAAANIITGGAGDDTLVGGDGPDTLVAGGGSDVFAYYAASQLAGDSIDGGANAGGFRDQIQIQFSGTADFTSANGVTIASTGGNTSIESLALFGGGGHNAIFNASQFGGAGIALDLGIQGDNGSTDIVTINNVSGAFSAAAFQLVVWEAVDRIVINGGLNSADNITGSSQADSLNGGDAAGPAVMIDTINGGNGNDTINGGLGYDVLDGGAGFDTNDLSFWNGDVQYNMATGATVYVGNAGVESAINFERVLMGNGNDQITGNTAANEIIAGGGNDALDGGAGADTLNGGDGNDFYYVDNTNDVVTEINAVVATGGYDIVTSSANYTLSDNVEQLVLVGGATVGIGGSTANYLYGGNSGLSLNLNGGGGDDVIYAGLAGGNTLNGGSGVDTLLIYGGNNQANGGLGSDIYYTYTATDVLSEAGGDGIDTVYATYSITLAAGFEQLLLSGTATTAIGSADNNIIYGNSTSGAVTISGLGGSDVIFGGAFNDSLSGGIGVDLLFGLDGQNTLEGGDDTDIYYLQTSGNIVIETLTGGFDTIYSNFAGVTTLAANVEQLILYGNATGGTGTGGNDYLYANSAALAVTLDGGGGSDYLLGSAQNDTLIGGAGNDQIDLASGGIDRVRYNTAGNMGADTVYNFNAAANDLIDLTGQGYTAGSISGAITVATFGGGTLVTFASGALAGTTINLVGVAAANVTAADFVF